MRYPVNLSIRIYITDINSPIHLIDPPRGSEHPVLIRVKTFKSPHMFNMVKALLRDQNMDVAGMVDVTEPTSTLSVRPACYDSVENAVEQVLDALVACSYVSLSADMFTSEVKTRREDGKSRGTLQVPGVRPLRRQPPEDLER